MIGSKVMALSNGYSSLERRASSSPKSDSTSTSRKLASGNSCKILMAIKRSDQKLRPLHTGTLVWSIEPLPHRKAIPHLLQGK